MKILRDVEWTPVYYTDSFPGLGKAFIFKNERYGDLLALNEAKWVDTTANKSYEFYASSRKVVHVLTGEERVVDDLVDLIAYLQDKE